MIILGIDPGIAIVGYGIIEYKNNKFKIGIITLDLSDIKAENGKQLFKDFFKKFKEICDSV